jgi:tellurite resistance protein TerC
MTAFQVPLAAWVAFHVWVLAMLALDLGLWHRTARVVPTREAALWTIAWVASALLFAAGLALTAGGRVGLSFLTGYLIEESLSADNVFVIATIFAYLQIPAEYQHRVLFWGILGALVMRGGFIAGGAYLFAHVSWTNYAMGALLLIAAFRMVWGQARRSGNVEVVQFDGAHHPLLRWLRRILPLRATLDGQRFLSYESEPASSSPASGAAAGFSAAGRRRGRWVATPLLVALLLVEVSDIAFATDSIPAVFSITRSPFVIYTSTVFAVFGLRSLYFLLAAMVRRFRYLPYGLAAVLTFGGLQMLLARVVAVPTGVSLGVVAAALAAAVAASIDYSSH